MTLLKVILKSGFGEDGNSINTLNEADDNTEAACILTKQKPSYVIQKSMFQNGISTHHNSDNTQ